MIASAKKQEGYAVELHHTAQREGELLSFLRGELSLSSGLVKRLKWQNAFFLDGAGVHTNARVRPGQEICVRIEEAPEGFLPQALDIDILYEDEYVIALDKPAGQLVHPSPQKNDGTLANALLGYYVKTGQRCGVHPVTRLDRDTFGVVLLAKNAHVHAKLCRMMKDGEIHKTYLAAVYGCPKKPCGEISLPVYKLGNGSLLRIVDPRGKRAVSGYRVLLAEKSASVLALFPKTGRTHQLRLHCKAAGFPILGDPQYSAPGAMLFSAAHGLFTQQLCAARLELVHPVTQMPLVISSRRSVSTGDKKIHLDGSLAQTDLRAVEDLADQRKLRGVVV